MSTSQPEYFRGMLGTNYRVVEGKLVPLNGSALADFPMHQLWPVSDRTSGSDPGAAGAGPSLSGESKRATYHGWMSPLFSEGRIIRWHFSPDIQSTEGREAVRRHLRKPAR